MDGDVPVCGCCLGMCLKHLKETEVLRLLGRPDREVEGLEWFDMVMICVTLSQSHQGSECLVCKGKGLGLRAILGSKDQVATVGS